MKELNNRRDPNDESESVLLWNVVKKGTRLNVRTAPIKLQFRRTYEGHEAIDFIFNGEIELNLESSSGFEVEVEVDDGRTILRLTRVSGDDDAELFQAFSGDLIQLTDDCENLSQRECALALANRISSWQIFMKRNSRALSDEKEVGLFGELVVLKAWLEAGGSPERLHDVWTGPLHGARDFTFGEGHALEVKTSLVDNPLKVKIDSIMQLDMSDYPQLVLAAIKIVESEEAATLLKLHADICRLLKNRMLIADFESSLMAIGFNPNQPGRALRSFRTEYVRAFKAGTLPRIVPGTVPGVVSARYTIVLLDQDGCSAPGMEEVDFENYIRQVTEGR